MCSTLRPAGSQLRPPIQPPAVVMCSYSELVDGWEVSDWDLLRSQLRVIMEQLPISFQPHFESFQSGTQRVTCLLSDSLLSWTHVVAQQLGIPRLTLHVAGPAEYQIYLHARELMGVGLLPFKVPPGRDENDFDNVLEDIPGRRPPFHRVDEVLADEEAIMISGLPPLHRKDFPSCLQIEDASDEIFCVFLENIITDSEAHMLLFNTFEALDGRLLNIMRSKGIHVRSLGPLPGLLEDVLAKEQAFVHVENGHVSDAIIQNPECLQWLDAQKPRSVIYVAFGTLGKLSISQMREFAAGLLQAGQPFIWAYRQRGREDAEFVQGFLKTFAEQAEGRGLVLEWAPQKAILQHPSVGAFLSHCGWNSTMESISCGVPMLCLPLLSDQFLTCKLLVEEHQIALQLQKTNKEGIVDSNQISRLIGEMLVGEVGKGLHARAQKLKAAVRECVQPGGSSRATVDAIIDLLT